MSDKQRNKEFRGQLVDPDDLVIIGLDTKDGTEHPLYDPRIKLSISDQEVASIAFYGVREPVTVRRNDGRLEVVDGRQRVRRARLVKAEQIKRGEDPIKVPCLFEKGSDADLFALSRTLNTHKADGPMTTAQNVQRMMALGKTIGEVALAYQCSEQTIRNYQAMLDLAPDVIAAMVADEISSTTAIQLASLPKADQSAVLADLKAEEKETGKKTTVEKAKKKVAEKQGKTVKTPKERIENARKLLSGFAGKAAGEKTKEAMTETLERLSKVLFSMGLEKLVTVDEE